MAESLEIIMERRQESMEIEENGDEPYSCELCDYKASDPAYLRTHMLTHTDVAAAPPKVIRQSLKRPSEQSTSTEGPPSKFIALVEQVHQYFSDTRPRFQRSPPEENRDKVRVKLTLTVPQSPHLRTKQRARSVSPIIEKRSNEQSTSTKGPPTEFVALAEQVHNFFSDTRPRFQRSPLEENRDKVRAKLTLTVPQSPHLRTKQRARSVSPIIEKSHVFKARPLNPKVFRPPDMSRPQPKPTTVPQPFNFTYVPRKVRVSAESTKVVQFKARPMPKCCCSSLSSQPSNTSSVVPTIRRVAVSQKEDGTVEMTEEEDKSHSGSQPRRTRRKLKW